MLSKAVHLEVDKTFVPEIWALFSVGVTVIFLRYIVRLRVVGWRGLDGDDYITVITLATYALDACIVTIVYRTGANVDVKDANLLTDADIKTLTYGSKLELAAWYSYTALIWCTKFTVLFFYRRLTVGTAQSKGIRFLFYVCGATYIAVFCTLTFGCMPFHDNWGVRPLPPLKCTFRPQNLYVTVVLNVITDAMIMCIPIPLLWRLKVTLKRKLAIGALLSSGLFVIAAAIIRAALSFGAAPSTININRWGVRESIAGVLAVQAPILRPLFTKAFWRSGPYFGDSRAGTTNSKKQKSTYRQGVFELQSSSDSKSQVPHILVSNSSQEDIIDSKGDSSHDLSGGVMIQKTYDIRHDEEASVFAGGWNEANAMGSHTKVSTK